MNRLPTLFLSLSFRVLSWVRALLSNARTQLNLLFILLRLQPKLARRHAGGLAKNQTEIVRVVVPDAVRNLGRAKVRRPHQFLGAPDAQLGQVLFERVPRFGAKYSAEMTGA